ncbi:MAG TPA: acetyl-CoA carboxylase biotin carboxyl carrier protein [Stellaceae bacterium]|nr:acetyl-CoA carboxylase biotin carboxyl carrier protein [Stellaceae bacterium]
MKLGSRHPPLNPDAEIIRALAELLSETGLTEIEYAVGDHRIRVARDAGGKAVANGHTYVAAPAPLPAPSPVPAAEAAPAKAAVAPGTVTSPIVGVAYLAAQPGAPPFVRVGDSISEGQTLLIIEAMKVMNQIRAPRSGQLKQVLIADAEPVEYGAPLMLIE